MKNLKELVSMGFLIDEDAKENINNLNEEDFNILVENVKKENPLTISNEFIKNIFAKEVKILKQLKMKKKMTIKDFVNFLNQKYNKLQEILIEKLEIKNVVSINKCGSGSVSIIGMVKTITDKGDNFEIFLEDPTGEIKTAIPKNLGSKIKLDDVIAVSGNMNNKILFVNRVIFPDVPLRPVNYSEESVKVGYITKDKKIEVNYVINKNQVKDNIKNKRYKIIPPIFLEIGGIKILIIGDADPLNVLKKRYLKKENSDFIIDIIPDVIFTEKDVNRNHKGITIVSANNIIDLKNREVNKIL